MSRIATVDQMRTALDAASRNLREADKLICDATEGDGDHYTKCINTALLHITDARTCVLRAPLDYSPEPST